MIKIKETVKNGYEKVKEHVVRNRGTYGFLSCAVIVAAGSIVYDKTIGKIEKGSLQVGYVKDENAGMPIILFDVVKNKNGRKIDEYKHYLTTDDAEMLAGNLNDAVAKCKETENG